MKKIINLFVLIFLLLSKNIFAGWPIFFIPPIQEVRNLITKEGCEPGYGRILGNVKIPIIVSGIKEQELFWIYHGNSQCHKLPLAIEDFQYRSYTQTGRYSGSQILISYGSSVEPSLFIFSFTIPKTSTGVSWDCGPLKDNNLPISFGCAWDT